MVRWLVGDAAIVDGTVVNYLVVVVFVCAGWFGYTMVLWRTSSREPFANQLSHAE